MWREAVYRSDCFIHTGEVAMGEFRMIIIIRSFHQQLYTIERGIQNHNQFTGWLWASRWSIDCFSAPGTHTIDALAWSMADPSRTLLVIIDLVTIMSQRCMLEWVMLPTNNKLDSEPCSSERALTKVYTDRWMWDSNPRPGRIRHAVIWRMLLFLIVVTMTLIIRNIKYD